MTSNHNVNVLDIALSGWGYTIAMTELQQAAMQTVMQLEYQHVSM